MIPWYFYAIGSVFFKTLFSITRKKALVNTHAMCFESLRSFFVVLISLMLLPFIQLSFSATTILLVYISSLLSTIGILYVSKAYKHGEISLMQPLDNFQALFVTVLAFFFLAEKITLIQISGMLLIVASAYLLESDHHVSSFIKPLKNLFRSKYSLYFIFATILFAVSSTLEKFIIDYRIKDIYALFFLIWLFIAINFNIIHIYLYGFKDTIKCLKKTRYMPVLVAIFSIFGNLLAYKAFSMAYISLVLPILTLTTLFVVLFGGRFFHEKYLYFRLSISLITVVGAILIAI